MPALTLREVLAGAAVVAATPAQYLVERQRVMAIRDRSGPGGPEAR